MKRLALLLLLMPSLAVASGWADWWLTPDQQGRRLMEQGDYLEAAERFADPRHKAAAFFIGGDYERAAAVWGRLRGPQAAYNRGTALIMLGRYDEAIASFDAALTGRPGWAQAEQNRAIAVARRDRLAPSEDDAGGTGGQLGADEIVFDDSGRVASGGTEVETQGGEALDADELRAVWLRRVQNDPAEFLRARFAYQLYRDEQERAGAEDR
jgi:Ca-activated chloride channel family protein